MSATSLRFHSKVVRLDFQTYAPVGSQRITEYEFSFQSGSIRLSDLYPTYRALNSLLGQFSFQSGSIRLSDCARIKAANNAEYVMFSFQSGSIRLSDT